MRSKDPQTYQVRAKQLLDGTWKAWAVGLRMVVFAKRKTKAIHFVEAILEDKGKSSSSIKKDLGDL